MLLIFCLTLPAWAADPITTTDLLKIQRVTDVQIAPDGSFAVYGVQSVHTEQGEGKSEPTYSYRTHLWTIDLKNKSAKPKQLTFGDRNDSGFAIKPDGKMLAFVRTDPVKRVPHIWVMPLDGGGEAQQVSHLEFGASNPVWHPSRNALLVSTAVPLSKVEGKPHFDAERPARDWFDTDRAGKDTKVDANPDGDRRSIRNWLDRNAARENPTVINRLVFQAEQGLDREMRISHLYQLDLDHDGKATPVTKGFHSFNGCSYAPDGAQIVCTGRASTREHPDRSRRSVVWMITADGAGQKALLDDNAESYLAARFYPDGKALLVTAQQSDEPTFRQPRLAKYELASGKLTWISSGWTSGAQQSQVASDGTVLFTSSWQGGVPMKRIASGIKDVISGPVGVGSFDEAAGRIVYSLISVPNPNELYVREKDGSTRRLTELNSGWLAGKQLSHPREKWITRPDGTKVQTWVMDPINAKPGRKYPWVLDMHGGPTAMWGPGELTMWHEFQLFCAWGYGVVYSNPRGSGGYGYEFQKANYKNWGEGPAGDVLAALDDVVQNNPLVDSNRLFITGGSYAGYLTAWIVSHDHRFKAAASQRGVYDLTTFYGEGNAFRLVENDFGGRPYDPQTRKLLDQQSPFTYVQNIRTPLLILHGSQDLRTGVTQSEMLYRALKDMGKPVEYIRYPAIGHELTRSGPPLQRMDHMLRIIEFFERYSNNDSPAPTRPTESAEKNSAQSVTPRAQ